MNWFPRWLRPTIYLNTRECKLALLTSLANELEGKSRYKERDSGVIFIRQKILHEQLKERL